MIESKKILIDSNVLIYAYDKAELQKSPIANKIVEKVIKNEMDINLSTQNISEFYFNVTKKIEKPVDSEIIKDIISDLMKMSNVQILQIEKSTILKAIYLVKEFKIEYWDALIAAVMQENNITVIITENEKHFRKIPWLEVVNPFENKN
mgnify:CR=1 FL=1